MPPGEKHYHAVQFYKDEDSLAGTVAGFLAEGFKMGQPAIVLATPAHMTSIKNAMTGARLDVENLQWTGELQLFDARSMLALFMRNGLPDAHMFRAHLGDAIERLCVGRAPCPIRAYGELVDVLWQDGNQDGAIKLEILWNQLASAYDFALLCGYSVGHFYKETADPRFQEVCAQHSHVIPNA
jgi:hypothetical protein